MVFARVERAMRETNETARNQRVKNPVCEKPVQAENQNETSANACGNTTMRERENRQRKPTRPCGVGKTL